MINTSLPPPALLQRFHLLGIALTCACATLTLPYSCQTSTRGFGAQATSSRLSAVQTSDNMAAITSATAARFQVETTPLSQNDMTLIDQLCKKAVVPPIQSRKEMHEVFKPVENLGHELHVPSDTLVTTYWQCLYEYVNMWDGKETFRRDEIMAVMKHQLKRAHQGLTPKDQEEFGRNSDRDFYSMLLTDDGYAESCFAGMRNRQQRAREAAAKKQPAAGHDTDNEMPDVEGDDAVDNQLQQEVAAQEAATAAAGKDIVGEQDLVLEAIQEKYKNDPGQLVKAVRQYTMSGMSKASTVKTRVDAGRNEAGRSKNIDCFAGKPDQLGKGARDWLSSVEVYLDSVDTDCPVPKIATYLRGDAQEWWRTQGKAVVGLDAPFHKFADAFLSRFVKAADGRKARLELSEMKQSDLTVEAFAAQFRSCAARIFASNTGTPVDSTTQAGYFQRGLKKSIVNKLSGTIAPEVMSDIDLLMEAAEKVEANLEMSKLAKDKDDDSRGNSRGNNSNSGHVQGNHVIARHQNRNNRYTPYQQKQPNFSSGRGNPNRGAFGFGGAVNAVQGFAPQELPPQEQQFQEAQFNAIYGNSNYPPRKCYACGEWGHIASRCPGPPADFQAQWQGRGRGRGRGAPNHRGRGRRVSIHTPMFDINAINPLLEPCRYMYAGSRKAAMRGDSVERAAQAEFVVDVGDCTAIKKAVQ